MTFLDCISVSTEQTYYVLDVMIWKDFSLYDCDTECRRFMLKSHMDENEQLGVKSRINPYIFKMLPSFPCDPESLHSTLTSEVIIGWIKNIRRIICVLIQLFQKFGLFAPLVSYPFALQRFITLFVLDQLKLPSC